MRIHTHWQAFFLVLASVVFAPGVAAGLIDYPGVDGGGQCYWTAPPSDTVAHSDQSSPLDPIDRRVRKLRPQFDELASPIDDGVETLSRTQDKAPAESPVVVRAGWNPADPSRGPPSFSR